jgi:hypothetical protein
LDLNRFFDAPRMPGRRGVIFFVNQFLVQCGRTTLGGTASMGTKRPEPTPAQQLEDLLKAHALRRLEGRSPDAPKRTKTKKASRRKKR